MRQKIEIKLAIDTIGAEFKVQNIFKHNNELYIVSIYNDNNCNVESSPKTYELIFINGEQPCPIACHYIITDEYRQELFNVYNRTCQKTVVISDASKLPVKVINGEPVYRGEGISPKISKGMEKITQRITHNFTLCAVELGNNPNFQLHDLRNQNYIQVLAQAEKLLPEEKYLLAILNDVYTYIHYDESFSPGEPFDDDDRIELLERLSLVIVDKADLASLVRSLDIRQIEDLRTQPFKANPANAVKFAESQATLFAPTPTQIGITTGLTLAAAGIAATAWALNRLNSQ